MANQRSMDSKAAGPHCRECSTLEAARLTRKVDESLQRLRNHLHKECLRLVTVSHAKAQERSADPWVRREPWRILSSPFTAISTHLQAKRILVLERACFRQVSATSSKLFHWWRHMVCLLPARVCTSKLACLPAPSVDLSSAFSSAARGIAQVNSRVWHSFQEKLRVLASGVAALQTWNLVWRALSSDFLLLLRRTPFMEDAPLLASIATSRSKPAPQLLPQVGAGERIERTKEHGEVTGELGVPSDEETSELNRARALQEETGKAQDGWQPLEEAAETTPEAVKIEALYVSSSNHYAPDILTSGYSFKPWTEYWALLNTGEIYLGLPHGDPRTFDFEEERMQNPHRFVALEHVDGSPVQGLHYGGRFVPFDPAKQVIAVNEEVKFKKVYSCDDYRLEGVYSHGAPRDFVESSEAFGLHGATSISFSKDGSFRVKGCTNICFRGWSTEERAGDQGADTHGSYVIKGNIIEFKYDGGGIEDAFFFEFPDSNDRLVSINGVLYTKKNIK